MQLSPSGALPSGRANNSTTYDPTSNRLTIFGGIDSSGNLLRDAWVLANANGLGGAPSWSQIASSSTDFAEARDLHTAVYNPASNKMIIFGGQILSTATNSLTTNDVWVLSDANGL